MTAKHTAPTMREALEQIIELEANAPSNGVVRTMLDIARAALSQAEPEPSEPKDEPVAWEPTTAQINSACLSFRHDFGLMNEFDRGILQWQAREWLRAWQKEGLGADHNEIIERRAQEPKDEPVAWRWRYDDAPDDWTLRFDGPQPDDDTKGLVVEPLYTRPALDREVALPDREAMAREANNIARRACVHADDSIDDIRRNFKHIAASADTILKLMEER